MKYYVTKDDEGIFEVVFKADDHPALETYLKVAGLWTRPAPQGQMWDYLLRCDSGLTELEEVLSPSEMDIIRQHGFDSVVCLYSDERQAHHVACVRNILEATNG